ncbi:MAG: hypothetical protein AB8I08_03795 [Sandaracinaceae bacterium]
MTTPCYYLNVTIRGYSGELLLNGAPMVAFVPDYQAVLVRPVSEWVLQGENVLSVRVDGGALCEPHNEERERRERRAAGEEVEEPQELVAPDEDLSDNTAEHDLDGPVLRVALCEGIVGEMVEPGDERELFVLDWEPPPVPRTEEEGNPLVFPHTVSERGSLNHPWGTWAWESAEAFDLEQDPGTLVDILDFLRGIHDALSANQVQPLIDASRVNYQEVGPCYEIDPADATDRMKQGWPKISEPDDFALATFDETDLDLRPCCGGRLLEARSFGGKPFLRQAEAIDGVTWSMPLFIGKVDGALAVVR